MANLAAGTQAGGLCAQRVCNPLVHGISQAYLFLQRSATSLGAQATSLCSDSNSATLEILHRLFVFLRSRARLKRAEIPTLACLRILLPRIQAIATGLKFSDHDLLSGAGRATSPPAHGQGLGAMDDRAISLSDATS